MLRALNRRNVLNHIRRLGPTSRTQLADLTGLSGASISGVTAELIADRLLVERSVGAAGASGGRRPIYLDIDYGAHAAAGMKLSEERGEIEAVLTDLSTRVLAHRTESLAGTTPGEVAAQVGRLCKTLARQAGVEPGRVIGVGIGLSGVIDAASGTAVRGVKLGWENVPLARLVTGQTGLPTWVDNDVNAFAAAERLFGHGKHARHFLVVAVGYGVGGAFVLNGEVYRGREGGAGEFGHNVAVPGGRPCGCGRRGCLGTYTDERAVLRDFAERHPEHAGLGRRDLAALADGGHAGAREVLGTAGRLLGTHLSYLVNALNPELVVIGGEGAEFGESYFGPLRETLHAHTFDGLADHLPVVVVPWEEGHFTPWVRGAASLAVASAFETGAIAKGETVSVAP